ncbi:uncharacterized protein LOC133310157 isoform X2 [Gastrolobium bilobum]|uniref:uncharacterized protein LOC133310157 isoform X2 n=1 Tax=Gastrolobium bilobum TaxID=150636 RepID=UPI002AAF2A3A|nr:uncharacterized protein LOC133310157 isoform X2 [Gastrolobium bilobum]XP_061367044.1 uncharacterized protein LOC133310157 isoform X2 [Gastrolobium bilobum]XP_061367045.1 uncharacterized protein LOC133310157 isoform X2 [Gastrolobium bilobum]
MVWEQSSKESSLKNLQELASQIFSKTNSIVETRNTEPDNKKKQQNKELHSNSNLSPLARFLLSRLLSPEDLIPILPYIYPGELAYAKYFTCYLMNEVIKGIVDYKAMIVWIQRWSCWHHEVQIR